MPEGLWWRKCLPRFEDEEHNVYNEKNDGKEAERLQEKKIAQSNSVNERKNKRMDESQIESVS